MLWFGDALDVIQKAVLHCLCVKHPQHPQAAIEAIRIEAGAKLALFACDVGRQIHFAIAVTKTFSTAADSQ